jgi:ABC-type glycerol-3-phosphate transport system substrate-binding protein
MSRKVYLTLSMLLIAAFGLTACAAPATEAPAPPPAQPAATQAPAQPAATEAPAQKVTVTWWHISTKDPPLSDWQMMADDYMAAHPNVNIEITVLENEAFKTKLTTVMQSGEVPDIFQSWGGGVMNEQIAAGLLRDITSDLDADGGAWRNDKWPGMHMWSYLATRIGGEAAFDAAYSREGSFADPAFVEAGKKLQELMALDPFQPGYLGATHDEMQAAFGNGQAAMELSGQWAPSVEAANSVDKVGVANLGLFNFPAVEGGAGDVTDVIGGGNGFAIGKNASPEAIDFVKYLTNVDNQVIIAAHGTGIPVVKGGEAGLTDPNMVAVQKAFAGAKYFQLYYDQYLPPAMGSAINDAVQTIFAGTATPEEAAQAIEDSAKENLK